MMWWRCCKNVLTPDSAASCLAVANGTPGDIFVPTVTHLGMPQPIGVYGIVDKVGKILGKEKEEGKMGG
jgi:hypothetical protein